MKPPKMTNFEQLKRPKTNRDDAVRPNYVSHTYVNSMVLNSDRDYPKDYQQSVEGGLASSAAETGEINSSRERANNEASMYRTDLRGKLPTNVNTSQWGIRQKNFGIHQQRLASFVSSQNHSLKQNLHVATQSTPSRVSKRFAGGFGGAGSVYTHSHITNTRKFSHYRITQGNTSNPRHPIDTSENTYRLRLNSQDNLRRGR